MILIKVPIWPLQRHGAHQEIDSLTAPVTLIIFEFVEDFTYLGSLISKDIGAQKDTKARLGKAR